MGLFDRLRPSVHQRESSTPLVTTPEKNPLALIDEGNALEDAGRFSDALVRYDAAIQIEPALARAHLNRGNALLALGEAEEAVGAYSTALLHEPEYAAAHYNMGNAYVRSSQREQALAAYRKAIALNPGFADAEVALGALHEDLGQAAEAAAAYRRALAINPDYAPVHANLAKVLHDLGQPEQALASYRRAIELDPQLEMAHYGMANALQALGRHAEAVASYRWVLQRNPHLPHAFANCGNALQALGRHQEAIASYREALRLDPDHVNAQCMLGNMLALDGKLHDAMACYRRVLEIDPENAFAHTNIGNVYGHLGQLRDALASHRRALEIKPDFAQAHSNLLFQLNYLADQPGATLLAEARAFGDLAARQARPFTTWTCAPELDRVLRVGIVSGDLRGHPVGYFMEGILARLAASQTYGLEVYAYPNFDLIDDVAARLKASCRAWFPVTNLTDEALAEKIHADAIDVLIDLSGHTANTRLSMFAWKPAPVQLSWLGYFATTGVAEIDYLIADRWTLPESEEINFTEQIWRLPDTRLCFTPPNDDVNVGPLPAAANGHVTFGCFNHVPKMNDAVVALWARILAAVPDSRLFLKSKTINEGSVRESIIARFAVHGISAARLILEGAAPRAEYLKAYQRVDIALDPFPYPGGTTSVEGMWMGVPVLTMAGKSFLARQGVGLLMNAGLPEWVARDADDYAARAVFHSRDLPGLAALRQGLREQVLASPIFDAARFADNFAAALRGMWQEWCARQNSSPQQRAPEMARNGLASALQDIEKARSSEAGDRPSKEATSDFTTAQDRPSGVPRKLHIGGQVRAPGWEVLNANPAPYVDHVCNANDLSRFADGTFAEIYASHVVEHLDYSGELLKTLKEWNRTLAPGGRILISVPDLDILARLMLEKKALNEDERFAVMRMIFGGHIDRYDYHVVGLNEEFLTGFLRAAQFINMQRVPEFGLFSDTSSMLFKGMPISLNMIAEKPGSA